MGLKLREMSLEPEFATGGPSASFLRSYGFKVHDVVREPVPFEFGGEMKLTALWYLRYWFGYRSTARRMAELVARLSPSLIVGDEEFSSVSLAVEKKIPHAMISDELQLGFARGMLAKRVESKVGAWYADLQNNVSHLLVPTFGTDSGNTHYMTPVVRPITKTRDATREEQGIPISSRMLLFSASGSGIGGFLMDESLDAFRKTCLNTDVFATSGSGARREVGNFRQLGLVRDNQNLVAAADLVVSTAGKSTIDEAASSGTPIIAIPIRNHAEQERNAAELGFAFGDIGRLDVLIPKLLGNRSEPANYQGAQRTADYLASLVPQS